MADRTVVYRLRAELAQFRAQMAQGSASVKKFADDLTGISKEGEKTRRGLESLGGVAGKIGLVAAAGFGAAALKAADFDQAMSNVEAATHESAANMEALRQAALDAGEQTVFSATESAAAIENLAKAGVSTTDVLGGGLQGALDLAAAGTLEVADAAEIAATAMTQFSLSGDEVPHIADLLAAGAGKAQGEVSDLSYALKQSGLVANQMGVSIEETVGALSAFASAGLLGSDAGTSFRTMLLRLANPSEEAKDLMQGLGIAAYDMQGNFVGIEALAGQLQTAFEGQTQATRDAALATIFGSDSIRAANVLYDQGANGIAEWTSKVDDAGYASETAAIKLDNLKGDFEALTGSLETALIGTGDSAQGPLRGITQQLTDVVNAYNNLPPAAKSAVGALLAGSAAIGGTVWVGTKIVRGISDTREALSNLGVSGTKATKAMKGLAIAGGALAGLTVAAAGIRAIQNATDEALPGVEALTTQLLGIKAGTLESLSGEFDSLGESIGRIADKGFEEKFADMMQTPFEGLFGEAAGLREAKAEIEALDAALANMVSTGNPEVAADALKSLADAQGLSATETENLLKLLPQYDEAVAGVANSEALAATATEDLAGAQKNAGKVAQVTTERLKAQKEALQDQVDAATDTADSFVGLGESLDKGKVSLRGWLRELEKQAEALANFRKNAQEAAKKGLNEGLIQALQAAGPEGALRMRQLANATEEQIARANKAWRSGQAEVGKYVDATVKVPKEKKTWITVESSDAMEKLRGFQDMLDKATKPRTARLALTLLMDAQGHETYGGLRRAQGGPVYGAGSATSDSIPAWLSNGEFVIKAAAVQRYGSDFFHKLNAMRFASGGMVTRTAASPTVNVSGGGSLDYDRLARAVIQARPLYGDVHISGDPTTFRRAMQSDKRAAGAGGF